MEAEKRALFPAHAGVILTSDAAVPTSTPIPRTRGGDPSKATAVMKEQILFPAHAGVILRSSQILAKYPSIPRTRRGDPTMFVLRFVFMAYSPHTRG